MMLLKVKSELLEYMALDLKNTTFLQPTFLPKNIWKVYCVDFQVMLLII